MAHGLPHARSEELPEVAIHRSPGRERRRRWQVAPLAPGPHHLEQAVEQAPQVRRARSTARLRWREERFEQTVLIIAQGLAAAEVSNQHTVLGCPHRRLPSEGLSPQTPAAAIPHCRSNGEADRSKRALRAPNKTSVRQ